MLMVALELRFSMHVVFVVSQPETSTRVNLPISEPGIVESKKCMI